MPLCSTEAVQETPDALHLDNNVKKQLVTIACRLLHHKRSGQPLTYIQSDGDKKEMVSSEALYHNKLRERLATLPELTQNPGLGLYSSYFRGNVPNSGIFGEQIGTDLFV